MCKFMIKIPFLKVVSAHLQSKERLNTAMEIIWYSVEKVFVTSWSKPYMFSSP